MNRFALPKMILVPTIYITAAPVRFCMIHFSIISDLQLQPVLYRRNTLKADDWYLNRLSTLKHLSSNHRHQSSARRGVARRAKTGPPSSVF